MKTGLKWEINYGYWIDDWLCVRLRLRYLNAQSLSYQLTSNESKDRVVLVYEDRIQVRQKVKNPNAQTRSFSPKFVTNQNETVLNIFTIKKLKDNN